MLGPIDKDILGKETAIEKLEITMFDQAVRIKEMAAELEVL